MNSNVVKLIISINGKNTETTEYIWHN